MYNLAATCDSGGLDVCKEALNTRTRAGRKSKRKKSKTAENLFQCPRCPKTFHLRFNLVQHFLYHDKPLYPCPTCTKVYKSKHAFTKHLKMHSRESQCSVCSQNFTYHKSLYRHIASKHGITKTEAKLMTSDESTSDDSRSFNLLQHLTVAEGSDDKEKPLFSGQSAKTNGTTPTSTSQKRKLANSVVTTDNTSKRSKQNLISDVARTDDESKVDKQGDKHISELNSSPASNNREQRLESEDRQFDRTQCQLSNGTSSTPNNPTQKLINDIAINYGMPKPHLGNALVPECHATSPSSHKQECLDGNDATKPIVISHDDSLGKVFACLWYH